MQKGRYIFFKVTGEELKVFLNLSHFERPDESVKLYEAQIIPALLQHCESWISSDESNRKHFQEFQEEFVRRLPTKITKVPLAAYRKLN